MGTYVIGDVHGRSSLVDQLLRDLPWDVSRDKIIFLGDLIDRGDDAPGVLDRVIDLQGRNPRVIAIRGNHEQMMIDCIEKGDFQWLLPGNGGLATVQAYGIDLRGLNNLSDMRIPERHFKFVKSLPLYHEDDDAMYVHAALVPGLHPSETSEHILLWARSVEFFLGYHGKLCFFGHTPTQFLPRHGRLRRHGIYINGNCVGIDTSGDDDSPLSCVQVNTFTLYQAHPSGVTEVEHLSDHKPLAENQDLAKNLENG